MTTAVTPRKAGPFAGDGITVLFPFAYKIFATTDVVVTKTSAAGVETVLAITVDYTVAMNADQNASPGGSVTVLVVPAVNEKITLSSSVPESQGTSLPQGGQWSAKVVENALDKATILVGQLRELLTRTLTYAISDTSTGKSLPTKTARANAFLAFDSNGDPIASTGGPAVSATTAYGAGLINIATAALTRAYLGITAYADTLLTAASAAAARVLLTPLTTKGDLWGFAAVDARVPVGTDGQAVVADSPSSAGLKYVTLGAGSVRQSVLQAVTDASGYANEITTGAGLRPGLSATARACVMAFANGFGPLGSQDLVSTLSADVADPLAADLAANNTSFLHASYSTPIAVTWGKTLVPPQYGYAFDRARGALLNFEGANGATTTTDDFGNTWTRFGDAQISTAQFKFGTSSTLLDGTGDYWRTTNITTMGDGSWEVSLWLRTVSLAAIQTLFHFSNSTQFGISINLAVAGTLNIFASSNGTSNDIASGTSGATVLAINTWYRIRLVFDALAGNYKVYLSNNGAAETTEITVASSARICAIADVSIGRQTSGIQYVNGYIDAFRFLPAATVTAAETPSAAAPTITDYPVHFFSIPEMKMYEVTAASGAAGVNPTLTQRNRVFVAEADTSGAAVTAVRNYALRGIYRDQRAFPAQNTVTSLNHNLGTNLAQVRNYAAVKTILDSGAANHPVGALMPIYNSRGDATSPRSGSNVAISRNAVRITNDNLSGMSWSALGGSAAGFVPASVDLVTEVERAF